MIPRAPGNRRALWLGPAIVLGLELSGAALQPAAAETLIEALATAYSGNPTLLAQRARLRATDETLPEARSGWRPTISATGDAGTATVDSTFSGQQDLQPLSYGLSLSQPLYSGGRTVAGVSRARNLIMAERAALNSVEQTVLLEAATAYIDVLRDTAVLQLNVNSEQVLRRELNATEDRYRVGELTLTDVAQARARLAGAVAGRIRAQGDLEAARAEYVRVIGKAPENLVLPPTIGGVPSTLKETLDSLRDGNPDLAAARYQAQASMDEIALAKGEMLPRLSLDGRVSHSEESSVADTESDSASITAQLSIPLYQAGGASARVRQAKQTASQRRIAVDEAERNARAEATAAWEALVTARAAELQFESQVEANKTALEGTREQARVGSRILLDVLNAEQELLDAQVSLVVAKRTSFVAGLALLASVGRLTARDLGLPVEYYDETAYFDKVKGKIWGTGIGNDQ
ncbi:MAG: TolC family outer membrane protein [Alphaproteobacteria bacterium]|nr:TolC family outer membrane protein [Alphaproteobacteria bacterium]